MELGQTIRRLRIEQDLTQEKLARVVGVVPQAVSKWERGEGLPDITLLPALAAALGCSTDILLGVDSALSRERVEEIKKEAASLLFSGAEVGGINPIAAANYLRCQLRKYPGEWSLWYMLASYLLDAADVGGETENRAAYDEAVEIFERMRLRAPELRQRQMGVWGLVAAYAAAGDLDRAEEAAGLLPRAGLCYEQAAPMFLGGDALREFQRAELVSLFWQLDSCVDILIGDYKAANAAAFRKHVGPVAERLSLLELRAAAWSLLKDRPWAAIWASRASVALERAAEVSMEHGDRAGALDYLERAAALCRPTAGEKPGYYALHDPATYAGPTKDILPSRHARKLLLTELHYAADEFAGEAAHRPLAGLAKEPRFQWLLRGLEREEAGDGVGNSE